jgi:prepilin signal peptidase PulO-like enzyme (type II secretory pathway)
LPCPAGALSVGLLLLAAMIYGVYLGSARTYPTYLSVLVGVLLSQGVQGLLYWLFGMFGRYQLLGIVRVSTPAVLGSYGAATRKPFAVAVTSTLAVFLVLAWTTLLWLGVALGGLASRLPSLPLF